MKKNDVCVVRIPMAGKWPLWYFARVVQFNQDELDNWIVEKFRVVGENFDRDADEAFKTIGDSQTCMRRIAEPEMQVAAQRLVAKQWGLKSYSSLEEVRKAVLEG